MRGHIKKLRYNSGGGRTVVVTLDRNRIVPEDPGQDTPAMVEVFEHGRSKGTATFECAADTGEVDEHALTRNELTWLQSQDKAINAFLFP